MNRILTVISPYLILAAGINTTANAALAGGVRLDFNPGVFTSSASGGGAVSSGSYFALDTNNDSVISPAERIAIASNNGLVVGTVQDASGSHVGPPDGTESPGIDVPALFFNSTGMHYAINPTNILTDDGAGNVTLDFSGWGLTWNGIERINLGTGAWEGGNADGVANVTCGVDCGDADTFTLSYSATVPPGDPSRFDGVKYSLFMTGTISSVPVPAAAWLFGSGLLGLAGAARRRKTKCV